MIVAVTGHRPHKIASNRDFIQRYRFTLTDFATECLREIRPSRVITGMAAGWDLAVGLACLRLKIPYVAAVPFKDQYVGYAPEIRKDYLDVFAGASKRFLISYDFDHGCFHRRNVWMVDHAERILVLWNGTEGGTANTVNYAQARQKPIDDVWDKWVSFKDDPTNDLL